MEVLFLDTVHPLLQQKLEENGFHCIDASGLTIEKCLPLLVQAEGIVIRARFRLDGKILIHAPNLKFIARSGAGMENIDVDYCLQRGIQLFNAPEGNRNAVAEHALGILLALLNRIVSGHNQVCQGIWDREGNRGVELDGKTVGIIGFGNNGSAFAKKLSGFDVEILAYDKYKSGFASGQIKETDLTTLMKHADVIGLHIPQTPETIGLIDDSFIDSCSKSFYLLNLSRGRIVETAALVRGLRSGKVLGAGLDVLEYESTSFESLFTVALPSDFRYLTAASNVILTPHVGGWTNESYVKLSAVLADKILQHFGKF